MESSQAIELLESMKREELSRREYKRIPTEREQALDEAIRSLSMESCCIVPDSFNPADKPVKGRKRNAVQE